jgi:Raf kinase inhibitor-like YbhB/YbcL family protein
MAPSARLVLTSLSVLVASAGCGSGSAVAAAPADRPASGGPQLTSPDFPADGAIPTRFTCKGAGDRPTLNWTGVPAAANSIAITVVDPDAPGRPFVHWVVYDLPAGPSGSVGPGALPSGARETQNSAGKTGWKPPCPPSGTHHYHFTLYADRGAVAGGSTADTMAAVRKQAIAQATLIGTVAAS